MSVRNPKIIFEQQEKLKTRLSDILILGLVLATLLGFFLKILFLMDLSIIIVSWNTKDLLRDCLKSVYRETVKYSFEVIVVDNNSPDKSAEMVRAEFKETILIANNDNKGFARANNQGLKVAKGKNILLLNPDTVVLNGAIDKMMDFLLDNNTEVPGIITCKLLNGDGSLQKSVNSFFYTFTLFV